MRILKQSHSAAKFGRALELQLLQNINKLEGDPLETKKNSRKSHSAEKIEGDPFFSLVRFCMLRLKSKQAKRGPFAIT